MEADKNKLSKTEASRLLRHDINNQLSGMVLCLEQLKSELVDPPADCKYYIDSISDGCRAIDKLLKDRWPEDTA